MYIYMYMYICIYVYICTYIYIYTRDSAAFILSATCEKKRVQETYIRFITKTNNRTILDGSPFTHALYTHTHTRKGVNV